MNIPVITNQDLRFYNDYWSDEALALPDLAAKICRTLKRTPLTDVIKAPRVQPPPDTLVVDLSESGSSALSKKLKDGLKSLGYSATFYGPNYNPLMPLTTTATHFVVIQLLDDYKSQIENRQELEMEGWKCTVKVETQRQSIAAAIRQQALQIVARLSARMQEYPAEQKYEMSVAGFSERAINMAKEWFVRRGHTVLHADPVMMGSLLSYRLQILKVV